MYFIFRFIEFSKELLNVNANFHPLYGSFQSTVGGLYLLSFSGTSSGSPGTAGATVSLRHYGESGSSWTLTSCSSSSFSSCSSSLLVNLLPLDVVRLEVDSGTILSTPDNNCNSFSGYLLKEMSAGPSVTVKQPATHRVHHTPSATQHQDQGYKDQFRGKTKFLPFISSFINY